MLLFSTYQKGIEQLFAPDVTSVGKPIEGIDGRHRVKVTVTSGKRIMITYRSLGGLVSFEEYCLDGKEMTLASLIWESGLVTPTSPLRPPRAPRKRNADPNNEGDWDRQGKLIEE